MKIFRSIVPLVGPLGLAGGIFVLDRATKLWRLAHGPEAFPWPGVLELTQHLNHGLIANIAIPRIPVIVFTSMLAATILLLLIRTVHNRALGSYALALILGGAIGNIYDRVVYGFVFDWILLFRTSVLNLADVAVMCGVLWYALDWQKKEKLDDSHKTS